MEEMEGKQHFPKSQLIAPEPVGGSPPGQLVVLRPKRLRAPFRRQVVAYISVD